MTHRTQLSQAEEALRQVARDERVRAGLTYAIGRLRDEGITDPAEKRSHHAMTDAARLAIIQRHATDTLGWTDEADDLIRDLLAVMPAVGREDITRGEYAIRLQPAARRAR